MHTNPEFLSQLFADRESQFFHAIVENSLDAILATDSDLHIVYANGASSRLLAQSLVGRQLADIWHEDDLPMLNSVVDWVRVGGVFSVSRLHGFQSVLNTYSHIEIVGTLAADWDRERAYLAAQEFLMLNPPGTLDAIWAASSEMALGAMQAVEEAGRQDEVKIFSNDVTPESALHVREGRIMADTHHGFAEWGWYGTKFAVMLALGQDVPATFDIRPRTMYHGNTHDFFPEPLLESIDWETMKGGQPLPESIRVGWIQMADVGVYRTATQFFERAAADARAHGINVEILTQVPSSPEDFSGQAAIIESYIELGVDVIVFSTIAVDVVKKAIAKARAAGIAVIIVNQLESIEGYDVACYIGCNNTVAGEISGYAVVDYLGGPGIFAAGQRVEPEPGTLLDQGWWRMLYEGVDTESYNIRGRVAIIEGISGHWRGENRLLNSQGENIDVDTITFPLYSHKGEFSGMVVSCRDATVRKRAEEKLWITLEKERQLNELRERFILNMSHEIRTPLAIISSSAHLLRHYPDRIAEKDRHRKLDQIMEQVNQMVEMLENILTVRQMEGMATPFSPSPINLPLVCQAVVSDIQLISADHNLVFEHSGDCTGAVIDHQLLLYILMNLLSNAIKYSPAGGEIHVWLRCDGETALLSVQDQGIGIPAAEQAQVFDNFYRATNVNTIRGTGLGLSIVKNAVERHRGTITVESEVGVGSTFIVSLPLHAAGSS